MTMATLVKEVSASKTPKQEVIDGIDKWKVENAAETLQRVMEIRQDKKLFAAALKVLKEKRQAVKKTLDWADNLK